MVMGKKIKVIAWLLAVLCIIFFVIYISGLSVFGYRFYVVLSGSMKDSINIYDLVISKEVSRDDIQVGDVISFQSGSEIVTHRVVNIEGGLYTTKGDNNNTEDDAKIKYENIKGKVIGVIPKFGKAILFFKSKKGLVVLFSAVFLIYFIDVWLFKREN